MNKKLKIIALLAIAVGISWGEQETILSGIGVLSNGHLTTTAMVGQWAQKDKITNGVLETTIGIWVELFGDDQLVGNPSKAPATFSSKLFISSDNTLSWNFSLVSSEMVTVKVFDLQGRLVKTLLQASYASGAHQWLKTIDHSVLPNRGAYIIRLQNGSNQAAYQFTFK